MARGWESKSVESQIESAESRRQVREGKSTHDLGLQRQRESLELSRTRVLRDLAAARNQGYRESLEGALHHLDKQLAALAAS
jgi:hypothetical protein